VNHLIKTPDSGSGCFTDWTEKQPLATERTDLEDFLDGKIFMTHFIRINETVRLQDLAVPFKMFTSQLSKTLVIEKAVEVGPMQTLGQNEGRTARTSISASS